MLCCSIDYQYKLHLDEDACCQALIYGIVCQSDSQVAVKTEAFFQNKIAHMITKADANLRLGRKRYFYLLDAK